MLHDQVADVKEFLELPAVLEGVSAMFVGDVDDGLIFWLRLKVVLMLLGSLDLLRGGCGPEASSSESELGYSVVHDYRYMKGGIITVSRGGLNT